VEGVGAHDVIVDCPAHDKTIALLEVSEVADLMKTYRTAYQRCRTNSNLAHIILFKNHGEAAGTSLIHPHSQLIATPVVSCQVRDRIKTFEDHLALYGCCVLCRMVEDEIACGERIIELN
jgi:UDPglucose--hexose-1-phosphate uridylyltransferase